MSIMTNHLTLVTYWTDRTTRGMIEAETAALRSKADYRKIPYIAAALPSGSGPTYCHEGAARHALDLARRAIAFADAASLAGSRAYRSLFGSTIPQCFDHTEVWLWHGRYIVTTEPYDASNKAASIREWCSTNRWQCAERAAWSMWNPPGTTLLLCAPPKRGADLGAILLALDTSTPIPFEDRERVGTVKTWPRRVAA